MVGVDSPNNINPNFLSVKTIDRIDKSKTNWMFEND